MTCKRKHLFFLQMRVLFHTHTHTHTHAHARYGPSLPMPRQDAQHSPTKLCTSSRVNDELRECVRNCKGHGQKRLVLGRCRRGELRTGCLCVACFWFGGEGSKDCACAGTLLGPKGSLVSWWCWARLGKFDDWVVQSVGVLWARGGGGADGVICMY
jgi:hypothetical protein